MTHPLTPALTNLSTEEINKKISELNSRLSMAYRWGRGDLVQQIYMLLEDYNFELQTRNQKQLEEMQKKNPNFKDIIDIK
jgi:hypothetical protein